MCWQIKPWLPSRSLSPPAERRGCLHQAGPAGPAPFTEDRLEALLAHHWDRFGTLLKSHKACFKSSLCETRSFSLPWAFQQLGAFNYSFSGLLYLPSSVCVGGMGWGRGGSGGGGGDRGAGGYNMSSEHLGLRVGPVDIGTIPGEQTRTQQALSAGLLQQLGGGCRRKNVFPLWVAGWVDGLVVAIQGANELGLCSKKRGNLKTASFQTSSVCFCCQFPWANGKEKQLARARPLPQSPPEQAACSCSPKGAEYAVTHRNAHDEGR